VNRKGGGRGWSGYIVIQPVLGKLKANGIRDGCRANERDVLGKTKQWTIIFCVSVR
jgi:hypothetical protein